MNPLSALHAVSLAAAVFSLCGTGQAQCFEANFGTSLGGGDDSLKAIQPIGFAFPFAGTTYTDLHVSTNGFFYLSNAAVPAPGSASGYGSAATLIGSMLSGSPRIAGYFDDLNLTGANGGDVLVNNTLPGRCVVTWLNAIEFGQSVVKTIQVQIFVNGDIQFFYSDGFAVQSGDALVGCSPGGGAVDPTASDLSAGVILPGAVVYETFDTGLLSFDLGGSSVLLGAAGPDYLSAGASACIPASSGALGTGCGGGERAFYESFVGPAAIDLTGSTLTAVENGNGGYDVSVAPLSTFVAPANAGLGLGDDAVSAAQPLGFTWDYPGGSTTDIRIDSNGRILLNGTDSSDFSPTVSEMLSDAVHQICVPNCDFSPDGATNVANVHFETDGVGEARITWNNVPCFNSANFNSVQVVLLHTPAAGGDGFEVRWQAVFNDGSFNDDAVVGFATGPGALDPGGVDLSATAGFSTVADSAGLALSAGSAPVAGTNMVLTTDNMPLSTVLALSVTGVNANGGVELVPGAPGCFAYMNLAGDEVVLMMTVLPSDSVNLAIPLDPFFIGVDFISQTVCFVPGVNPFGLLTSNAVEGTINSF